MHLQINAVSHIYTGINRRLASPSRPPRPALQDISFEAPAGAFIALIGPSGCGKSTLLRLMANLLQPSRGQILLDGQSPAQAVACRRIAWMAQSPALLPWLTVRSNVALAQRFQPPGLPLRISPEEALQRVGLSDVLDAYPIMLSGGMQHRLALARTLTLNADLWLMDEPFAALDELSRERLTQELLGLWLPYRPTVLWVTHNIYEAVRLADRVLVFSPAPGRLVGDIPIDLPRPRCEEGNAYQQHVQRIRTALLHGDAQTMLAAPQVQR